MNESTKKFTAGIVDIHDKRHQKLKINLLNSDFDVKFTLDNRKLLLKHIEENWSYPKNVDTLTQHFSANFLRNHPVKCNLMLSASFPDYKMFRYN